MGMGAVPLKGRLYQVYKELQSEQVKETYVREFKQLYKRYTYELKANMGR